MSRTRTLVLSPRSVAIYDKHSYRKTSRDISPKRYRTWWTQLAEAHLVEQRRYRTFALSTPGTIAYQRRP